MDPRHTGEMLKHLTKQSEYLMDSHKAMSHQLHQLQVEEEMLMRKLHDVISAHRGTVKMPDHSNVSDDTEAGYSTALVCVDDKKDSED